MPTLSAPSSDTSKNMDGNKWHIARAVALLPALLRALVVQSAAAGWLLAALGALHPDAPKLFASLCKQVVQLPLTP